MTYRIESEEGIFEGPTESDAKRAQRKAREQARKLAKVEKDAYELAKARAERAGYRVLARLADSDPLPRAWAIVGTSHYAHKLEYDSEVKGHVSRFETTDGRGSWAWAFDDSRKVRGALCDGTGYAFAIFLACDDSTAVALGVATIEGTDRTVAYVASLPGVTLERAIERGARDMRKDHEKGNAS